MKHIISVTKLETQCRKYTNNTEISEQ